MMQHRIVVGRLVAFAVVVLLGLGSAPAAHAAKAVEQCPSGQTRVRLESKTCPANNQRPTIILRRACCEKLDRSGNPKVHCKHFERCPRNSPDGH